jgi:hypothetical protein
MEILKEFAWQENSASSLFIIDTDAALANATEEVGEGVKRVWCYLSGL